MTQATGDRLFLSSGLLAGLGARHGFSLRTGGVSAAPFDTLNLGRAVGDDPAAVDENLGRLLRALGVAPTSLATVNQVHGDRVVRATAGAGLRAEGDGSVLEGRVDADAIVAAPGRSAGVRTADCVPILLFDPRSRAAAAVHAGWRGTVERVLVRAIDALVRHHGSAPTELRVAIGPRIGRCCFEVGPDLADRFAADPSFGPGTVDRAPASGGPRVDLVLANERLLEAAGVQRSSIDVLPWCTVCHPELFFSHRRDAGRTGRHLSIIEAGPGAG